VLRASSAQDAEQNCFSHHHDCNEIQWCWSITWCLSACLPLQLLLLLFKTAALKCLLDAGLVLIVSWAHCRKWSSGRSCSLHCSLAQYSSIMWIRHSNWAFWWQLPLTSWLTWVAVKLPGIWCWVVFFCNIWALLICHSQQPHLYTQHIRLSYSSLCNARGNDGQSWSNGNWYRSEDWGDLAACVISIILETALQHIVVGVFSVAVDKWAHAWPGLINNPWYPSQSFACPPCNGIRTCCSLLAELWTRFLFVTRKRWPTPCRLPYIIITYHDYLPPAMDWSYVRPQTQAWQAQQAFCWNRLACPSLKRVGPHCLTNSPCRCHISPSILLYIAHTHYAPVMLT